MFFFSKLRFCYVYPYPIRLTKYKGTLSMGRMREVLQDIEREIRQRYPVLMSLGNTVSQHHQHFWAAEVSDIYSMGTIIQIHWFTVYGLEIHLVLKCDTFQFKHNDKTPRHWHSKLQLDCRHGSAASWSPPKKLVRSIKTFGSPSFHRDYTPGN